VGHPQVAAFARLANGGAKATREIAGQNTLFTRTMHDMAYDSVRDEIIVPQFFAFAILTFRGDANGNVAPVRKILGRSTQLKNPMALAVDPVHGEIFVPQDRRVLVFPRDADGDVPPLRILEGPDTGLRPSRLTVDPIHNRLIVSGGGGLRIFDRTASGNTKPLAFISHQDAAEVTLLTTYPEKGMIFGIVTPGGRYRPEDFVAVWSIHDDGDVPPRWTIGGPNGLLKDARGVAVDVKNKNVIVSDKTLNAVLTFHVPEAF